MLKETKIFAFYVEEEVSKVDMLDLSLLLNIGFKNKPIRENEIEALYQFDHEYFVEVKDEEIGKQLYDFIKTFKFKEFTLNDASITFGKYRATLTKKVKWFSFTLYNPLSYYFLSKLEEKMTAEILAFIKKLSTYYGWNIDASKFDKGKIHNISEFLSFFRQSSSSEVEKSAKGCLIEYVHCVLSGDDNLKEFYDSFLGEKVFYQKEDFPYAMPIVKMCYEYYKNGTVPENDIFDIYVDSLNNEEVIGGLVANLEKLKAEYNVTAETEEYTVYNDNIKIFKGTTERFNKFVRSSRIVGRLRYVYEQPETLIINFSNQVIGYKYTEGEKLYSILEVEIRRQEELGAFIKNIMKFFNSVHSTLDNMIFPDRYDFDFEKCMGCYAYSKRSSEQIVFNTIQDYYEFMGLSEELKNIVIVKIYYTLFAKLLKEKYGELNSQEQIRDLPEVKYLSPLVVKEFINFVLNKEVNYTRLGTEFIRMTKNFQKQYSIGKENYYYDLRYGYSPNEVTITFDYEVEKKYGANVVRYLKFDSSAKGKKQGYRLPDDRWLVVFKKSEKAENLRAEKGKLKDEIFRSVGSIADEHVKYVEISEIIINTVRLNNDEMYNVMAYITTPLKGTALSFEKFLTFDNKKLIKTAGYLFIKFGAKYISWEHIWMDDDFNFYVDYLESGLVVKESDKSVGNSYGFINWMFSKLQEAGYNRLAFLDFYEYIRRMPYFNGWNIVEHADWYDAYCDEHQIFYISRRGAGCPACAKIKYNVPTDYEKSLTKVFEDDIAIHYKIDKKYNLKIYKPTCECLHDVEMSINEIINCNQNGTHRINKVQDCFIPCKKAVNSNGDFIGIVYETVKFEVVDGKTQDVCVDLRDSKNLNNLARLKGLKRFMSQINRLLDVYKAFVADVFTYVFLNTSHKKQVQILNIEFINIKDDTYHISNATKSNACKYVLEVLKSDPTLQVNIDTKNVNFEDLLGALGSLEKKLTKYCPVHKKFYSNEYICCPDCISPEMQIPHIEYKEEGKFNSNSLINEGGESFIHSVDAETVVKIFKEEVVDIGFKSAILCKILAKKELLSSINVQGNKYKYVIPEKLLVDPNSMTLYGYSMFKVKNAFPISILKDKVEVEKLSFSKKDIFEILITIGEGIETLHEKANIYIGDLNGRNILFDREKNVYFLDFDGMGVDDIVPEFCTDGYIDPVSKKNRNITKKDDWYSFAVQAFYYLTYTHPFNGIYYDRVRGQKVLLEIPDKMERRVSLLGNHGMKPPSIALEWDSWMSENLRKVFLEIFEGDYRESIVPQLKEQCSMLGESLKIDALKNITRINPKFVAIEIESFDRTVVNAFRDYIELSGNRDVNYLNYLCNNRIVNHRAINQKLITSPDKNITYLIQMPIIQMPIGITAISNTTGTKLFDETAGTLHFTDESKIVMDGSILYYTGKTNSQDAIFKLTVLPNGEVKRETIKLDLTDVKYFDVRQDTKYVFINSTAPGLDEVYCNSEKFFEIKYNVSELKASMAYKILYDENTKSWAIINNYGYVLIIKSNGEKLVFTIEEFKFETRLDNIVFFNGHLYIPDLDCVDIVNVKTQKVKKLTCENIMNPDSIIFEINSQGFSVITDNVWYEVQRNEQQ